MPDAVPYVVSDAMPYAVSDAMPDPVSDAMPGAVPPAVPDAGSGTEGASAGAAAWEVVEELVRWLDRESALPPEQVRLLRILKLSEEAGEVAQAVIGATGQNPRKGHSHTWDDVQSELCDVIVTAMVALRTLTPEARGVLARHLGRVAERAASLPGPSASG